jgi:hypothetical protein
MKKNVAFLILGMKSTDHGTSEQVISSPKLRLILRSQVLRPPLCDMIAIYRSETQFHPCTPNHEILSIKLNRFQCSSKTTERKLSKIRFFGLLKIPKNNTSIVMTCMIINNYSIASYIFT